MLEAALGTALSPALLEQALTHRSYAYENGGLPTNERLEFLGDAVLGLTVTEALYVAHPDLPEGSLAKLRAAVVNTRALAGVARALGLGRWLRLGKGELATGGCDKNSILADTMEALLGAVYLERGFGGATAVVRTLFGPLMAEAAGGGAAPDWKTALQELTAARGHGAPGYAVSESGPDHAKAFEAEAVVGGEVLGTGRGGSKKQAEQGAARAAWQALSDIPGPGGAAEPAVEVGGPAAEVGGPAGLPAEPAPG